MKILAIDTSTMAASCALMDENKLHGEFFTDYKLKHSEKLMPLIDNLLTNLRMDIRDVDAFAVGAGPGSFTGLRIGAATAKGLAHSTGKELIGVSSIDACAYGQSYFSGVICPIFDAQQNAVYSGFYHFSGDEFVVDQKARVITLECLLDELPADANVMFCGDGVIPFKSTITNKLKNVSFANESTLMPRASSVAALALKRALKNDFDSYENFLPQYIRQSQAEVNYQVKG